MTQTEKPDRDEENKERLEVVMIEREIPEGEDSCSRFEKNVKKRWSRELFKVTAQELAELKRSGGLCDSLRDD